MKLFYDNKDRTLIRKIKYLLKHPLMITYWFKEVKLGIKNVFRKNSAKMIIGGCLALLGVLFIISVFFYNLGKFVVTVDPKLAEEGFVLSSKKDFSDERYKLYGAAIMNCNNINIDALPLDLNQYDGQHNGKNYVAYTFYIKNDGKKNMSYHYSLNIGKKTLGVEKAAWVLMYMNGSPYLYAMGREDGTPERQYSYQNFPIVDSNESLRDNLFTISSENRGYLDENEKERLGVLSYDGLNELRATPFIDENTITNGVRKDIKPGVTDKYTVIVWLEGEDPQCVDQIKGGTLEINMSFEKSGDTNHEER